MNKLIIFCILLFFLVLKSRWEIPDYFSYLYRYESITSYRNIFATDPLFSIYILVFKNFNFSYDNFRIITTFIAFLSTFFFSIQSKDNLSNYIRLLSSLFIILVYLHGALRQGLACLFILHGLFFLRNIPTNLFLIIASGLHLSFFIPLFLNIFKQIYFLIFLPIIIILFFFLYGDKVNNLFIAYSSYVYDLPTRGYFYRAVFFILLLLPYYQLSKEKKLDLLYLSIIIFFFSIISSLFNFITFADRILTIAITLLLSFISIYCIKFNMRLKLFYIFTVFITLIFWINFSKLI